MSAMKSHILNLGHKNCSELGHVKNAQFGTWASLTIEGEALWLSSLKLIDHKGSDGLMVQSQSQDGCKCWSLPIYWSMWKQVFEPKIQDVPLWVHSTSVLSHTLTKYINCQCISLSREPVHLNSPQTSYKIMWQNIYFFSHWWLRGYSRHLSDMKCTVVLWRSWVRASVRSNLGCIVLQNLS